MHILTHSRCQVEAKSNLPAGILKAIESQNERRNRDKSVEKKSNFLCSFRRLHNLLFQRVSKNRKKEKTASFGRHARSKVFSPKDSK